MSSFTYSMIHKYVINAVCAAPLHIGSAEGEKSEVLIHPVNQLPFIQASSIAGVLRSASDQINGQEITDRLFGYSRLSEGSNSSEFASRVKISDGNFRIDTVRMELRPRLAINAATGSVNTSNIAGTNRSSGHKFEMELIGAGAEFSFEIYLFDNELQEAIEKVLGQLNSGHLQFGGQKSNGAGFISVNSVMHAQFDMTKASMREKWATEDELKDDDYDNITDRLGGDGNNPLAYVISMKGKTEGALLVKGIAIEEFGKDAPGAKNIRNANQEYIVPGSSFKGAIRNHADVIAKRLGKEYLVHQIFGKSGTNQDRGNAGCISVKDTIVGSVKENDKVEIQRHIHIDKFTGGVMSTALFSEKSVFGDMNVEVLIYDKESADAATGLLIYTMRDLAAGLMNIGSGYSNGRGFIKIEQITVADINSRGEAVINLKENRIIDPNGIIQKCLSAVASANKQEA